MKLQNFSQFIQEAKNPCWSGYRQLGTKKKNGKAVPNCVPVKESDEETYSFDELSQEAKQNAINNNRDAEVDFDWWDPIIEEFEKNMEEIGMKEVKCEFSGFYSQGDGASFTGWVADNKKFLESIGINPFKSQKRTLSSEKFEVAFIDFCDRIYIKINRDSSRYFHHNTVSAEVELDSSEDEIELDLGLGAIVTLQVQELCDKIQPGITEWAREKSKNLYRELEKCYEDLTSDEGIASNLRSGYYRFDSNGNIV
jgi:hypothetical protein